MNTTDSSLQLTPCVSLNSNNTSENSSFGPCVTTKKGDDETDSLQIILSISISAVLAIIMIGIGCTIEVKKLVKHFKNPTGIITGLLCQFVIMPILGYMWASIFSMEDPETLSLLIVGSCPGGTFSNIVAYWIDGDMELSVTMTTVSIIVSLGMLPFLLYIYSLVLSSSSTKVPFDGLGISIALVLIPLAVGAFIRYKWKQAAIRLSKILAILGVIALVLVGAISVTAFFDEWEFRLGLVITAIFYPICGMILGYAIPSIVSRIATPLHLSHRQRRTVSIETGIQNAQIAASIVQMAGWSVSLTARVILFPMMYGLSMIVVSFLYIVFYHIINYVRHGKRMKLQINDETITEKPNRPEVCISTTIADNPAFDMKE